MRIETIGRATLYLGDNLQVMPTLARVDAVITDPPYGLGEARKDHQSRNKLASSPTYERLAWDDVPAPQEALDAIRAISDTQIIFGGNYFPLPPSKCWLVWDKVNGENDFADAELAWTNINGAVRVIRHMWAGMLRDSERADIRVHPNQKPVAVMAWAIDKAKLKPNSLILDPYMGSGTTGVAAMQIGHRFIGIEAHEPYFDAACQRMDAVQRQGRLIA
jgi:DNA modification methylase